MQLKALITEAIQTAPDAYEAAEHVEVVLQNNIQNAARELPDAAFRMWTFAMVSPANLGPEHWNVDIFREALGFSAAKVSRAAQDLIKRGLLRRQLINRPGTRGRTSLWYFATYDEAAKLANELDPSEMASI
jgi:hypothetical protein